MIDQNDDASMVNPHFIVEGRSTLTLTSATPVTTADVTGVEIIYLTRRYLGTIRASGENTLDRG